MKTAPIPSNEAQRMESLLKLGILDTKPEERFDRITKICSLVFNVPISTVTFVDSKREWFKSVCGLDQKEGERAISFCGHALFSEDVFVIPDTTKDEMFKDNPMVIGEPFIRFYAGVPLKSADGQRVGVLCIKDKKTRDFTENEKEVLRSFGLWAELEINTRNVSLALEGRRESENELTSFFNISQDLMSIISFDGIFKRVNPSFCKLLGYTEEEITNKPLTNFIHPEDKQTSLEEIKKIEEGNIRSFMSRYQAKNGNYYWLDWNAMPYDNQIFATARNVTDSKEADMQSKIQQQKLELLTKRFDFATKSAKIGIWEWDIINNHLIWDNRMYELYGITADKFGGAYEAWQAGLHPDDKKSGDDAIQSALSGEKEFDTSFRVVWPDKSIHYIKAYGSVERDSNGVPKTMVGMNWDITSEKKYEQQLAQFEAVITSTDDAIIAETLDGTIIAWNQGAEKLYGYTKNEVIGKSIYIIAPEDADNIKRNLKEISDGKHVQNYKTIRKRKSGDSFSVSITYSPIVTSDGKISAASIVARDISEDVHEKNIIETKVQERTHELREEQSRFIAAINSVPSGFIIIDAKDQVIMTNNVLPKILGETNSKWTLQQIHDKLLPSSFDLIGTYKNCIETQKIFRKIDLNLDNKFLQVYIAPIMLEGSTNVIGSVVLLDDVTEKMVMERSKDEFFSIASHELRTPLTSIKGNTSMIKQFYSEKINDKDLTEMIDDIHESSVRLIELVNEFLDVSRLEQKKIVIKKEKFSLNELVTETVKELKKLADEKNLYLEIKNPDDPNAPLVFADRNKTKEVLINLISNALKFTESGGIDISFKKNDKDIIVYINDTGRGISEQNKNLLFRKFQQAGDNILTRDTVKGAGLGLYITKMLLEAMGGTINLDRSVEGKGSTFKFTLPFE